MRSKAKSFIRRILKLFIEKILKKKLGDKSVQFSSQQNWI